MLNTNAVAIWDGTNVVIMLPGTNRKAEQETGVVREPRGGSRAPQP